MNNIFKKEKGFTLLEMLITILIISVGVLGTYTSVFKYSKNTQKEKEAFIATYLCQEGVEIIKNMRDSNWVAEEEDWNNGLTNIICATGCEIDYLGNTLTAYSAADFLYINPDGTYRYEASGVKTPWTRRIIIDSSDATKLAITVSVYWGSNTKTIKETIYNWK
ncbi:MAG: prepilin-type N-terminal cleavage/methylation domain-containing protein [Candidatus Paceibacterota bacterium]|jgi:prepilin-type N-terminal cleavage/methylation domain-containing protein